MKCPIDDVDLMMSERQGIEIDYCPKCRGVWLDRGELDKIIEKSAMQEPAARPMETSRPAEPRYDDRRHQEQRRPYKKRESFLGELFDF